MFQDYLLLYIFLYYYSIFEKKLMFFETVAHIPHISYGFTPER